MQLIEMSRRCFDQGQCAGEDRAAALSILLVLLLGLLYCLFMIEVDLVRFEEGENGAFHLIE